MLTELDSGNNKRELHPESTSTYQDKPEQAHKTESTRAILGATHDLACNDDHDGQNEGDDNNDNNGIGNDADHDTEAEESNDSDTEDDDFQTENSDTDDICAYDGDSSSLEEDDSAAATPTKCVMDCQPNPVTPPSLKSKTCGKRRSFEDLKKAFLSCEIPEIPTKLDEPPLEDPYTLHVVTRPQMPFEDLRDMFFGIKESLLTSASFKLEKLTDKSSRDSTESHDSYNSNSENSNEELDSNDGNNTESDGSIVVTKRNVSKQPRVILRTEREDKEKDGEKNSGDVDEEGPNDIDNENKEGDDSSSYGSTTDEDDQEWFCKCCKNWMPNSASECSKCHAKKGQSPQKADDTPRTMETWRCEECDIWMLASVRRCSICRARSPAIRKRKSGSEPASPNSSKRVRPSGDRNFKKIKRKSNLLHNIIQAKRRRNNSDDDTGKKSVQSKSQRECCTIKTSLTFASKPLTIFCIRHRYFSFVCTCRTIEFQLNTATT